MRFDILGPLEVWDGDLPVPIRAPKLRALLAVLLLHAGDTVPVESLIDRLWGDNPPRTARVTLQNHVRRLRQLLQPDGDLRSTEPVIVTEPGGYRLRIPPDALDLRRYEALLAEAEEATRAGDAERAAMLLRRALALWRGPALADLDADTLRASVAPRLEELRLAGIEARIEADLRRGRHAELVGELTSLAAAEPLRERLHELLMLALYRSGRQADALAVFHDLRQRLVAELAIEPVRSVQELHRRILDGDPALDPPAGPQGAVRVARPLVPRQLPPDVASFTGRERELAQLDRVLVAAAGSRHPVMISSIEGTGGVGKSALAIHVGHRLADRFPDGQVYVNLHGATAGLRPLPPLEALGRMLRTLGVDGSQIPTGLDEAAAQFRTVVAGRRLLLLLDNAADDAQVAPLLPGSGGAAVLVTSRQSLGLLGTTTQVQLDVLSESEAVELLGRLADTERVAADPAGVADVVRLCGRLPLALRIAGARLAARPGWPVRELAIRLADARRRLDELELPHAGVRASFDVSFQQLSDGIDPVDREAAAAFALLGLLDGPDVGTAVAGWLLDRPVAAAERVLERLVDAHLLESPAPGRYGMHDLMRLYAREHAADQYADSARVAALTRVFECYLGTAAHAFATLRPGDERLDHVEERIRRAGTTFADATSALAWLDAERANLVAAVGQIAATPGVLDTLATDLAHALFAYFQARCHPRDELGVNRIALDLAARSGNRRAQAQAYNDIGAANDWLGRRGEAFASYREALAIYGELGDDRGQAGALSNLGVHFARQERYDEAVELLRRSLTVHQRIGERHGVATNLCNLGVLHQRIDRLDEALRYVRTGMAAFRELGDRQAVAFSLSNLGALYLRQERYDEALATLAEALAMLRELGDRRAEAEALCGMGTVHQRQGRYDEALACQRQSLAICVEVGERNGEAEALEALSATYDAMGRDADARSAARQARAIRQAFGLAGAEPEEASATSPARQRS
jgi:DNA-binding SARP family transcriptional activator/tetratricopeptide (TPR) repeat protein